MKPVSLDVASLGMTKGEVFAALLIPAGISILVSAGTGIANVLVQKRAQDIQLAQMQYTHIEIQNQATIAAGKAIEDLRAVMDELKKGE